MSHWIVLILISWFAVSGCHGSNEAQPTDQDVEKVIQILKEMPAALTEKAERTDAEQAASRIAQFDSDTIRAAMRKYGDEDWNKQHVGEEVMVSGWKLYIVTKYLFELPETVRRDSPYWRFFAGWLLPKDATTGELGKPKPTDTTQYRWPWAADKDGVWHLSDSGLFYSGGDYQAMEAFDFYREHFPRRRVAVLPSTRSSTKGN